MRIVSKCGVSGLSPPVFCNPNATQTSRYRVESELEKLEKRMTEDVILVGHSNTSMTMDLYSPVLGDEKEQETLIMEDLFLENVAMLTQRCYYNNIKGATDRRLPLQLIS